MSISSDFLLETGVNNGADNQGRSQRRRVTRTRAPVGDPANFLIKILKETKPALIYFPHFENDSRRTLATELMKQYHHSPVLYTLTTHPALGF